MIFSIAATGLSRNSHPDFRAALEIAVALALIVMARVVHRRPPNTNDTSAAHERSKARAQAVLGRLSKMRVLTTIVAGFMLGIGGPKRLVLTCLTAAVIVTAGVGDAEKAALVVVYVTIATVLVWGPLILFLLIGKRIIAFMDGAKGEIGRRQPHVTVFALLVLAALLLLHAGAILLA